MRTNTIVFISICMFALLGFSQAQNIRLTFSSQLNCDWHAFDSVVVTNLSQSNYAATLHYPDTVLDITTSVGIQDAISNGNMEILTYPNPFSNTTQISLHLFQAGNTTLTLYDLLGRKITQHSHYLDAGQHGFNLESCPNGYYLLQVNTPQGTVSSKLLSFGNNGHTTPSISYNGIEKQHEKNLKLYDPSFLFNIGDNLQIQTYVSTQDTSLSNTFYYTVGAIKSVDFMADFYTEYTSSSILIGKGNLFGFGEENILQQNMVITNNEDWETLKIAMNSYNNTTTLDFTNEFVDFSKHQVIAVFDEIKLEGIWTIDIVEITEYPDRIEIEITNLKKGGVIRPLIVTQPFHIVKIPASAKKIVFINNLFPY